MKDFRFPRRPRNLLFATLLFALLAVLVPETRAADAQVLIRRAANFGNYNWLEIWIDGQKVEKGVAMGHDFRTTLSPGHHVIGLARRPRTSFTEINHVPLDLRSGESYKYTAFWRNDRVVLETTR